MTDTIFALSSGRGKAGVSVVRVSGVSLQKLFSDVVKPTGKDFSNVCCDVETSNDSTPFRKGRGGAGFAIMPRHAYLADLVDAQGGIIDRAIAIYFSTPHSFTGEDVIEFHTHGSAAVVEKLFDVLRGLGARLAEPGEFSRRAFDNNKMDLIEADGLCALLDARTDRQRQQALKSMTGTDSKKLENWRSQMIEISAFAAAILDYDENDLPKNIKENLVRRTQKLHAEIASAISRSAAVRAIHHGFNIALVGDVNVGKSSLFNRLVGESRAIVSSIPGTTRDVVSAQIDMDGYLVKLSDTAGLRETNDTIEKIGIEKTNAEIENADLVIRVISLPTGALAKEGHQPAHRSLGEGGSSVVKKKMKLS
jgi:tRNA modification GTPase